MFCTNCGKEIIDTARFCNFCGAPVNKAAVSVPAAQTDPYYQEQTAQTTQPTQSTQPTQPEEFTAPETQSEPVTSTISPEPSEQREYSAPESETDIPMTEGVPEPSEIASEITSEMPTVGSDPESTADNSVTDGAIPTPNTIPSYGESANIYSAPPVYPSVSANGAAITQEIKAPTAPVEKPERKYTFGHLMLCLAAVAVMAIVAGVFAGLYFSVA